MFPTIHLIFHDMKHLLSPLLLLCSLFTALVRYHGGGLTGERSIFPKNSAVSLRRCNVPPASGAYPRNK